MEKRLKNKLLDLRLHKPFFHTKYISWAKKNIQLSHDITLNALHPMIPHK
jgi:hypothetical protein